MLSKTINGVTVEIDRDKGRLKEWSFLRVKKEHAIFTQKDNKIYIHETEMSKIRQFLEGINDKETIDN